MMTAVPTVIEVERGAPLACTRALSVSAIGQEPTGHLHRGSGPETMHIIVKLSYAGST